MPLGRPVRVELPADTPVNLTTDHGVSAGEAYLFQAKGRLVYLCIQPAAAAPPAVSAAARCISPDEYGPLPEIGLEANEVVYGWVRGFGDALVVLDAVR